MLKCICKLIVLSVLAGISFLWPMQAKALDLSSGEVEASLDTTLSYGVTVRVEKQDEELTSQINDNDGDLNYDRGIVSNAVKFTSDLDVGYQNLGLFLRATGFFDHENENGRRENAPLSDEASALVGKDLDLLDAYVTAALDFGDVALDVRLGKHVLNWGESTFIQQGINAINPFDVSKLRVPGAELREALVAVPLVSAAMELPSNVTIEAFYQLAWDKTEIDPVGTYFSTTDYVGPGATRVFINDPRMAPALAFNRVTLGEDPDYLDVRRGPDRNPRDAGQGGIAFRYLAEGLNNTEFGFYFMNYHSRLPRVRAHTGTLQSTVAGMTAVGRKARQLVPALIPRIAAGLNLPPTDPRVQRAALTQAVGLATPDGIDLYADAGHYFVEYPEDIQLYGLSFSTQLGTSGWALQGEYSLRRDTALQVEEAVVLTAGLAPFLGSLERCLSVPAAAQGACIQGVGQATDGFDNDVRGYIKRSVSQVQATATKVFGPTLGADGLAFIMEAALQYVHSMPETNLESPAEGPPADSTSYGYRMAARLDYNNAVGSANLFPYIQFQQDVKGNGPAPIGQFVDGRTALTLGLRVDYLSRWEGNVSYTQYAGKRSEIRDRDFITATLKYSF